MSIVYDPSKMLRKIAPESKVKKLISKGATLKRSALSFVSDIDYIDKKRVTEVALKTVKSYQERIEDETVEKRDLVRNPRQLIQRVQNEVVLQVHDAIKEKYAGKKARWLPSDADEPRPEHQKNYGKIYIIGEGIDGVEPGDEPGCKCGVEILVDETQLDL